MSAFQWLAVAATAAALSVAGGAAHAAQMQIGISGKILSGEDDTGLFGSVGDLTGDRILVKFLFDPELGNVRTILPGISDTSSGDATAGTGMVSPIEDTSVTINGLTRHIGPVNNGFVSGAQTFEVSSASFQDLFANNGFHTEEVFTDIHVVGEPPSLDVPVHDPAITFSLADFAFTEDLQGNGFPFDFRTFGSFSIDSYDRSAVPEPGIWAFMIAGLGMVGGVLRRSVTRKVA